MPSEIDDIFDRKPKAQPNIKKRKFTETKTAEKTVTKVTKRAPKRPKISAGEKQFADSRGSTSRRRTEEGYVIYKEDELGIVDSGGDTPLCPFDCNCCF